MRSRRKIRRMSRYVLFPPAMKGTPPTPPFVAAFRTAAHFVTGRWEQFDISFGFVHDVYPPMLRYTACSQYCQTINNRTPPVRKILTISGRCVRRGDYWLRLERTPEVFVKQLETAFAIRELRNRFLF